MATEELQLRISLRKLLIGLMLTVIPMSLIGLYTLVQADRALTHAIGTQFKTLATATAEEVSMMIHDRVMVVGTIAINPTVREAVISANQAGAALSEEAFRNQVERMEKSWNTPAAEPFVQSMLTSQASRLLLRMQRLDPRFLRITITDRLGAVVAATHKTLDYYQADEDFWQAIYADGRGAVNVTDILYDEVTKANYIGIGVPIMEEGTNRFIGTVDALVDMSSVLPLSRQPLLASTMRVLLVKDDGTIIGGPNVTLAMAMKSPEFEAVRDSLQTIQGRQTGFLDVPIPGGEETMIGFADTGLRSDYRNLGWLVLVAQNSREAFAPVRGIVRLIWLFAIVSIVGFVFLVVYFSLHRRQRFQDIRELAAPGEPAPGGDASG